MSPRLLGASVNLNPLPARFPLTAGTHALLDVSGNPFFIHADSPWSLMTVPTDAEVETYLSNRAAKGFNALVTSLVEHFFCANPPANVYGVVPFTTPGNFGTPNESYFARCFNIIQSAASRNMLVILCPDYWGFPGTEEGWDTELQASSQATLQGYGTYLAGRFAALNNILWNHGADGNGTAPTVEGYIAAAIKAAQPKWLHTYHGLRNTTARVQTSGAAWLTCNSIYTDAASAVTYANQEYGASTMPFFLVEGEYEPGALTAQQVRMQAWSVSLWGATGQAYGHDTIWPFLAGWQTAMNSTAATQLQYLPALFATIPWSLMPPDTSHAVVTPLATSCRRKTDGTVAVIYNPQNQSMTVTMTQLAGPTVRARWYDPTTGTYTTDSASPLANTGTHVFPYHGTNAGGGSDWVLVLDQIAPSWPSEPAGFVLTSELDFAVAIPTGAGDQSYTNGWGVNQHKTAGVSRVTDASAPFSPSFVAKFDYTGQTSGTEPANLYLQGVTARTEIYMAWWAYISNPWTGEDSGVNKYGFLYTDGGAANSLVPEFFGSGNSALFLRTALFELGVAQVGGQSWAEPNVGDGTIPRGVWHRVEMYAKFGTTSSSGNGILKQWLTILGTDSAPRLVTNYTNINYANSGFNAFSLDPVWGGNGGSPKPGGSTDYLLIDHVRISHA